MKSYSKSDILAFREIHYKIKRKAQINEFLRSKAKSLFEEEFKRQQEAEKKILDKDAVKQINDGDLYFKELIFWDGIIEKLLQLNQVLTHEFFLTLTYLEEQECLSTQSEERLVKYLLDQQILELKQDTFIFQAIELLMRLGHKFIDEMFIMEMVLRLINHKCTYYILRELLKDDDMIFTTMTKEIRYFIKQIQEQADKKQQERIIKVILKQRPQLVDQDRSLFGLPLNKDESKENQEQN